MERQQVNRLITRDLISLSEPPTDKRDCIEYLLDVAVDAGRVTDRSTTLADLLERERDTTTGVGEGIAIPHAKSTGVETPTVLFTRSTEGVDFEAMDDEPATLIFMLLVPPDASEDHLTVLGSLSRALIDEKTRDRLHEADSPGDVVDVLLEVVP